MALSKDEWFKKLKNLVPAWVFQDSAENVAIFSGIAKILEQNQQDYEAQIQETFIDTATEDYLNLHGDERSIKQFDNENISAYRERVKKIVNSSNLPAIKSLVDALLIRGESTIIEHDRSVSNFLNRGSFLDRNIIDYDVLYNAFTILIDFQIPDPETFFNRGSFLDREFIGGSNTSSDNVFKNVIDAVNENKAYGTVYRLIERANR